jgi:ribosome-binding ATPase YchF (GTP1/OBG family)
MNSMDSEGSTYTSPSSQSEPFSDIEMLEKEIMIAKNDMITAYHDKVSHFEPEF